MNRPTLSNVNMLRETLCSAKEIDTMAVFGSNMQNNIIRSYTLVRKKNILIFKPP
jgi:aspartate carbamoyltransferase regulatory subunit